MIPQHFLGLDIGASKARIAALTLDALRPSWTETLAVERGLKGAKRTLEEIARLIKVREPGGVAGLCVAIAAQVDINRGVIVGSPNLGWNGLGIAEQLGSLLGVNVTVENDVRAAAWGEFIAGAGRGFRDLAAVFIGSGIGGGIIVGGELLYGAGFTAGEVGHLPLTQGKVCGCGGSDCVESVASSSHLEERARTLMAEGRAPHLAEITGGEAGRVRIDRVVTAARAGDKSLRQLTSEALELWTRLLLCIAMVIAPQVIVLGGGVFVGWDEAYEELKKQFAERKLPACRTELRRAALGDLSGAIGAAQLCMLRQV